MVKRIFIIFFSDLYSYLFSLIIFVFRLLSHICFLQWIPDAVEQISRSLKNGNLKFYANSPLPQSHNHLDNIATGLVTGATLFLQRVINRAAVWVSSGSHMTIARFRIHGIFIPPHRISLDNFSVVTNILTPWIIYLFSQLKWCPHQGDFIKYINLMILANYVENMTIGRRWTDLFHNDPDLNTLRPITITPLLNITVWILWNKCLCFSSWPPCNCYVLTLLDIFSIFPANPHTGEYNSSCFNLQPPIKMSPSLPRLNIPSIIPPMLCIRMIRISHWSKFSITWTR